jgi:hypothetical protein
MFDVITKFTLSEKNTFQVLMLAVPVVAALL